MALKATGQAHLECIDASLGGLVLGQTSLQEIPREQLGVAALVHEAAGRDMHHETLK